MSAPYDPNSTAPAAPLPALLSPKERLQRSRQALLEQMTGGNPPVPVIRANDAIPGADGSGVTWPQLPQPPREGSPFSAMSTAAQAWWKHHPAHAVLSLATPLMHNYAARQPWMLLGVAAAAGAAVVLFKPWRLISFGGVLVALIKSTTAPGVLVSMLTSRLPAAKKSRSSMAANSGHDE